LTRKYGKNTWALVTGATDGIGKGMCEALALEGFNIILVSRTLEKLKKVASELQELNKDIKTHVVAYDFSQKKSLDDYKTVLKDVFDQFEVSILVNDVGVTVPTFFHKMNVEEIYDIVSINTMPQTILTKFFLDKVLKTPEKRTAIINLSSSSAAYPARAMSIYTATKAYDDYLSRSLAEDFVGKIDIISIKPYFVATGLSKVTIKDGGLSVITGRQCGEATLDRLGYEKHCAGHWKHELLHAVMTNLIPNFLMNNFMYKRTIKKQEDYERSNAGKKTN
jgi:17beta-estradiol 17-dehydrogenase / very-long-chain 3-oxoacyl-CoA reductase